MGTTIPANKAAFTLEEIVATTAGTVQREGGQPVVGVSTDTRRIAPGNAFVALQGEAFDGHDHVQAACDAGASVVVVSRPVQARNGTAVVVVADTLKALGELARAHKRRWARQAQASGRSRLAVAVTGSAGKTTTCRAIRSVLEASAPGAVHGSAGNLNNAIGVPMVLLGLDSRHELAVVELGTSAPGEIAYGVSLVEPDISVLTLVSCAHAQGLGSIDGVAREKGAIFASLGEGATAVVNGDDARARAQWEQAAAGRKLVYGRGEGCDVRLIRQELDGTDAQALTYAVRTGASEAAVSVRVPLLGDAGAYACAAALAVDLAVHGTAFDAALAGRGMQAIQGEERRLRPRELGSGVLVIDDAYNANPASMADSVQTAARMAKALGRRLVLVLGEMRELGQYTDQEHATLGRIARQSGAARLIAVAGAAAHAARAASSLGLASDFVETSSLAAQLVRSVVATGDIVLVKGSRGVALERVIEALEAQTGGGTP